LNPISCYSSQAWQREFSGNKVGYCKEMTNDLTKKELSGQLNRKETENPVPTGQGGEKPSI